MPRIGIELGGPSYLPEAHAYADFLRAKEWSVELSQVDDLSLDNDIHLYFMGWRPFWKQPDYRGPVVLEYHSASTGHLPRLKNLAKAIFEQRTNGRIFLTPEMEQEFRFLRKVPTIYRPMGVDSRMFGEPPTEPDYDVIYCGSIAGRPGLVDCITAIADLGLRVVVVGEVPDDAASRWRGVRNIELTGRLERSELPAVMRLARAGLNFVPDIYPFNVQTSTKVIEYCAAGLGIVSNRYEWIESFLRARNGNCLWLDELKSQDVFHRRQFDRIDVSDLEWQSVLTESRFEAFLTEIIGG